MDFFRTQFRLLGMLGHPRQAGRMSLIIYKVLSFYIPLAIGWFLLAIVKFTMEHFSQIELATEASAPLFTGVLSIAKIVTCFRRKEQVFKIIDHLKQLSQPIDKSTIERDIIRTANKRDKFLTVGYLTACLLTVIYFVLAPIVKAIIEIIAVGERNPTWTMPMLSSFIFNVNFTPVYQTIYTLFSYSITSAAIAAVGMDSVFSGCCLNLCAHFKILQRRFQALSARDFELQNRKVLIDVISYHIEIMDLTKELDEAYKPIVLSQFLIASLQICVLGFQLGKSLGQVSMFMYLAFISAIIIQLLIYAYNGTQIMVESESVATAIYCSKWYEADPKTRKILLLCLMRSQKCNLIRAGTYKASLETFSAILSTSVSYITLLNALDA